MNARIFFFAIFALSLLACCANARSGRVSVCNHDMKAAHNKRVRGAADGQHQNYLVDGKRTYGTPRINIINVKPADDKVGTYEKACSYVNQTITVNGAFYNCSDADLVTMNSDKWNAITELMDNVIEDFFKKVKLEVAQVTDYLAIAYDVYGDVEFSSAKGPYDMQLVQTFRPDSASVIGSGESLAYDQNGRPILGHINWNPKSFDISDSRLNYNVALHSFLHVLGFSSGCMMNFRNVSTETNSSDQLDPYTTAQVIGRTLDGREMSMLATPRVAKEFHEYSGCDDLEGALLEDLGGSSVTGSHWKMSAMMDEIMTASVSAYSLLTSFTIAALEDSGWYYNLDYSSLDHTMFGYKKGCDFF